MLAPTHSYVVKVWSGVRAPSWEAGPPALHRFAVRTTQHNLRILLTHVLVHVTKPAVEIHWEDQGRPCGEVNPDWVWDGSLIPC